MNDQTTPLFSHSTDRDLHVEVYAPRTLQWLYETVTGMVDEEIEIEITALCADDQTTFRVECERSDVGMLIGKKGRHAQALRMLLFCRAKKEGCRYVLDIVDYPKPEADEATETL